MLTRVGYGVPTLKSSQDNFDIDKSGTVRQIGRDVKRDPLLSEPSISHDWYWVCETVLKAQGAIDANETSLQLIDTVFFNEGLPVDWLFKSKESGIFKRKSTKHTKWRNIYEMLVNYHNEHDEPYIAVVYFHNDIRLVERSELRSWYKGLSPVDIRYMQPYIPTKTSLQSNCNFKQEFSLASDGKPVMSSFKLGVPTGMKSKGGGVQRSFLRSKDLQTNRKMELMTQQLVRCIEQTRYCKVVQIHLEFTLSLLNEVYLTRSTSCIYVKGKRIAVRPRSRVGQTTVGSASSFENELLNDTEELTLNKQLKKSIPSAKERLYTGYTGPKNMSDRFGKEKGTSYRERTYAEREAIQQARLDGIYFKQNKRKKKKPQPKKEIPHFRLATSRTTDGSVGTSKGIIPYHSINSARSFKSIDSNGKLHPVATSAALGSSQTMGCSGDFCDYEMLIGEEKSAFDSLKEIMTENELQITLSKYTENRSFTNNQYKISYRQVVQARAEKRLVSLMIRRHERGEAGDYILSDVQADSNAMPDSNYYGGYTSLAQKFASHYYRDVTVCSNCFRMYNKIDEERENALTKIHNRNNNNNNNNNNNTSSSGKKRLGPPSKDGMKKKYKKTPIDIIRKERENKEHGSLSDLKDEIEISPRSYMLKEAQEAIGALTKADVAELRTLRAPPPQVILITSAIMVLLTGEALPWGAAKRIMANGERFINMLTAVDETKVSAKRINDLKKVITQPMLHPTALIHISEAASRFAAFLLGVVQYYEYSNGCEVGQSMFASTISSGGTTSTTDSGSGGEKTIKSIDLDSTEDTSWSLPPVHDSVSIKTTANRSRSFAEKLEERKRRNTAESIKGFNTSDFSVRDEILSPTAVAFGRGSSRDGTSSRSPSPIRRSQFTSSILSSSRNNNNSTIEGGRPMKGDMNSKALTRKERVARKKIQDQQMQRLFAGTSDGAKVNFTNELSMELDPSKDGTEAPLTTSGGGYLLFTTDTGVKIPYLVLGNADVELKQSSFIVCGDFFDTLESIQIFLRPVIRANYGCQILIWNIPGQAYTTQFDSEGGITINNEYVATVLHQLLQKLQIEAEFVTFGRPFYLIGFGNGANTATYFSARYGEDELYSSWLKGLVSFNGFAHVDNQLAAILHSSVNVFSCFPSTRPDLPISYFSRFLFSDGYLNNVEPNLALNIYTAVSNPISLDGRVQICKGALKHVDIRSDLPTISIPIVLVQGTENLLVNPTHVDAFLEGRHVKHVWSHQSDKKTFLHGNGALQLKSALSMQDSALVIWLRTGHELRQEAKKQVLDLINSIAAFDVNTPIVPVSEIDTASKAKEAFGGTVRPTPIQTRKLLVNSKDDKSSVTQFKSPPSIMVNVAPSLNESVDSENEPQDEVNNNNESDIAALASVTTSPSSVSLKMNFMSDKKPSKHPVNSKYSKDVRNPAAEYVTIAAAAQQHIKAVEVNNEIQRSKQLNKAELDFEMAMEMHRTRKKEDEAKRRERLEKLGIQTESSLTIKTSPGVAKSPEEHIEDKVIADSVSLPPSPLASHLISQERQSSLIDKTLTHSSSGTSNLVADVFAAVNDESSVDSLSVAVKSNATNIKVDVLDGNTNNNMNNCMDNTGDPISITGNVGDASIRLTGSPSPELSVTWESKSPPAIDNRENDFVGDIQHEIHIKGDPLYACDLEATLSENRDNIFDKFQVEQESMRNQEREVVEKRINNLKNIQEERRRQWEEEDRVQLKELESEMAQRRATRARIERERTQQLYHIQMKLAEDKAREAEKDALEKRAAFIREKTGETVDEIASILTGTVGPESPRILSKKEKERQQRLDYFLSQEASKSRVTDISAMFREMQTLENASSNMQGIRLAEYNSVKAELEQAETIFQAKMSDAELNRYQLIRNRSAVVIQANYRGYKGRNKAAERKKEVELRLLRDSAAVRIQSAIRGYLVRWKMKQYKEKVERERVELLAARSIQRNYRGYVERKKLLQFHRERSAIKIQSVARGRQGRLKAQREIDRLAQIERERLGAISIQSGWRMKVGRDAFMEVKKQDLAARFVQRVFRGHRGRIRADRVRQWAAAEPGPERLQLGLRMIKESQDSFERQKQEINALHRAQQKTERLVSDIHSGLKESEFELRVLESELNGIDELDREIHELTHEKEIVNRESENDKRLNTRKRDDGTLTSSEEMEAMLLEKKRAQEAYELEMAIHVKRAERERKKKELEAEFAGVFKEVGEKKDTLNKLELKLQDMESNRQRKDREFQRIQRNLMELLGEQKQELDQLRQKGIELETATASSAAAAAATAAAAKEHEERSGAIFDSTSELLKFQFMSMSMSYFSSLNMLKNLRDMSSDTTTAAISSSAETASAAAAAAAAANIPSLKHLKLGAHDLVSAANAKKRQTEVDEKLALEEAEKIASQPFPIDVTLWKVTDVTRWLTSLSLAQYAKAFAEASIDGEFLIELRAEDMRDVLGVEHELHVKKICLYRDKLRPLTEAERKKKKDVLWEETASQNRTNGTQQQEAMSIEEVFTTCRNGRIRKLQKYLDNGFAVDTEDAKGNTLLLVACQQVSKGIVELLLSRDANLNHQNIQGNTGLHYAMAYDTDGALGEFLISRGADDMLENIFGLSPYDGISLDGA